MSGQLVSLPDEIKELMTNQILWESFQGFDGYGQPEYAAGVELTCWIEPQGVGVNTGQTAERKPQETVTDPDFSLYFDGDDPNVRSIRLWDRFTPGGVGSEARTIQATAVETLYGPPFDNLNPWLVVVST